MESVEAMQQLHDFKMEQLETQMMGYKKKIESLEIKDQLREQKMEQIETQMMGYKNKIENLESKQMLNDDKKMEKIQTQMKGSKTKYELLKNEDTNFLEEFRNMTNNITDKSEMLPSPSSSTVDPLSYKSNADKCMLI